MRHHKPRILAVLLLANLALLVLPLGGLWMLRLYESALVRQTETELISQAAIIAAAQRAAWLREAGQDAAPQAIDWAPRFASLDLARDPILPPPPDAAAPDRPADPLARAAGAAIAPVLAEAQRVTLAAMRVTDQAGVVVASTGSEDGLSLRALEEVAAALAGQPAARVRARREAVPAGAGSISRAAPFRVFVALPVQAGERVIGAVLLSRTPSSLRQALHGKRWELAALSLAMLVVAGGLAGFIAYTVSRPIRAVADQARAVAAGARVEVRRVRRSAVREADELATAIAGMAETLERRAAYISDFAAAVSHEFKTPLAALRGALELLQDHGPGMSAQERANFLAQCMEDVQRLDRLVTRLLDLARAETPQPQDTGRAAIGDAFRDAAAGRDIAFAGDATAEAAIAPEALRSILGILFDNVRQHAGPQARCAVACRIEGDVVRIGVSDNGRGISGANARRVFDRFFTTARAAGGTGLGLAIARSLAEAAGGGLDLLPGAPGATFELRLPAWPRR
ncbi:HAMP domain-containing sensor histidine kinase [Roseomonas sp. CECT 9278]|uniref:sensor histidine kinase n=1 Tax=Roseomonas sp. CECT 9278 TaxID=2845823 RepID=UPI001E333EB4|nr:HAMP domain-containing sensor histidine kinase [Roseomonas sp. CECT 9278]CAH0204821.1 Sensor histidine kinase RcsC [Roseomonas sp. CECT 9278]